MLHSCQCAGFDRKVLEAQEEEERERQQKKDRKRDRRVSSTMRLYCLHFVHRVLRLRLFGLPAWFYRHN